MCFLTRPPMAVLLLVAVVLLASTSASFAGGKSDTMVIQLTPAAPDDDPDDDASGTATLSNIQSHCFRNSPWLTFTGRLTVTCAGLTPGAMYEIRPNQWDQKRQTMVVWPFKASGKGTGAGGGPVQWGGWLGGVSVAVVRLDEAADGTVVATTVLTGGF